jgi:hypothetical protein
MSKLKLLSHASGTGNVTVASPATNSDRTITLPDGDGAMPLIKLETAVTASGTAVDFTSIPSWVKRITVMLSGVSTNGSSAVQVQIGTSGGVQTTGYNAASAIGAGANTFSMSAVTTGFGEATGGAALVRHGSAILSLLDSSTNTWSMMYNIGTTDTQRVLMIYGTKPLSATLDRIRITTVNGTDTFDAGTINIMYEG